MANGKWTKWAIGLSAAALFIGLVGVINGQEAAGNELPATVTDAYIAGSDDRLRGDSGQSGTPDKNAGQTQNRSNWQRETMRSAPSAGSTGRMRTHAS